MVELTVPQWEDGLESAYYLPTAYTEAGWSAFTYPVKVSCQVFTGTSILNELLEAPGCQRQ